MATNYCCVPLCKGTGGHRFPSNETLKQSWISAIKRVRTIRGGKSWQPGQYSTVCYAHFKEEDYLSCNKYGLKPLVKRLRNNSVPSVFAWSKKNIVTDREARLNHRSEELQGQLLFEFNDIELGAEAVVECEIDCEAHPGIPAPKITDSSTQTEQTGSSSTFTITSFKQDNEGINFFTGLPNFTTFNAVLYSLGEGSNHLTYLYPLAPNNLSTTDLFFLVLIKLRQGKTNFELSRMFGLSEKDVYSIFVTWIRYLSLQWREIDIWPSKDLVNFYSPLSFKCEFPNTRVIIDGTEIPVKKPKAPLAQQVTFSTYKNRNTAKVLIGATPGGLISFISSAYGGCTSDRQIVERSNLVNMCDPRDSIMADKGFDVQDIFAPYDITVNIPTFFKKKSRMNLSTVMRDRRISSKRVHIERIIGLGKTYKILKIPFNHTETEMADDIIFVCFMLCNFRNSIM